MDMKTGIFLLFLGYLCYCMKADPEPVSELDLAKFTGCFYTVSIHNYIVFIPNHNELTCYF